MSVIARSGSRAIELVGELRAGLVQPLLHDKAGERENGDERIECQEEDPAGVRAIVDDARRFIAPGPGTREGYGRFLAGETKRADGVVLVAEVGGSVAGYVYAANEGADWMSLRGPAGVIYDIAVDPDRRRAGVGTGLLEAALSALAAAVRHGEPFDVFADLDD